MWTSPYCFRLARMKNYRTFMLHWSGRTPARRNVPVLADKIVRGEWHVGFSCPWMKQAYKKTSNRTRLLLRLILPRSRRWEYRLSCRVRPERFHGSTIDEIRGDGGSSCPSQKRKSVTKPPCDFVKSSQMIWSRATQQTSWLTLFRTGPCSALARSVCRV